MVPQQKMSHLEMLKDQLLRCDEELFIFLKRRIQTARKMAEQVTKKGESLEELDKFMEDIHFKAMSKSREMGFDLQFSSQLFGLIEDETLKEQKKVLEK
jgi:chorismate mutase